jgi:hypothetical protein
MSVFHVAPGALCYNAGAGSADGRILDARQRKYAFGLPGKLVPPRLDADVTKPEIPIHPRTIGENEKHP